MTTVPSRFNGSQTVAPWMHHTLHLDLFCCDWCFKETDSRLSERIHPIDVINDFVYKSGCKHESGFIGCWCLHECYDCLFDQKNRFCLFDLLPGLWPSWGGVFFKRSYMFDVNLLHTIQLGKCWVRVFVVWIVPLLNCVSCWIALPRLDSECLRLQYGIIQYGLFCNIIRGRATQLEYICHVSRCLAVPLLDVSQTHKCYVMQSFVNPNACCSTSSGS